MIVRFMALKHSDEQVLTTLARLMSKHGDQVITQTLISTAAGYSLRTTQRSLSRLMQGGYITGEFRFAIGYRYQLTDDGRTALTGIDQRSGAA